MTTEVERFSPVAGARRVPHGCIAASQQPVWRWNRVCYGIWTDGPLRIEIRFCCGSNGSRRGANAAFSSPLGLRDQEYGPVDKKFRFEDVKYNFLAAARHGLGAQFIWPGDGRLPAGTLILKHLLPLARAGLKSAEIAVEDIDRYLGTIEERVRRDQTGSQWAFRSLAALDGEGTRDTQHRRLTEAMLANQKTEKPVHTWELPQAGPARSLSRRCRTSCPRTCFSTAQRHCANGASVMDWRYVRHVPSRRRGSILRIGVAPRPASPCWPMPLRQCSMATCARIMNASPATTSPIRRWRGYRNS